MDTQIENIHKFLNSLDGSIDDLELKLQPIISKSLEEVVENVENPIEKIEIYNNFSYVLVSIIIAYLRSNGVDTTDHPIMKELDRVKLHMKRHKDLVSKNDDSQQVDQAKQFLQQTLGNKSGTDNTLTSQLPAISSTHFQNNHKRFK